MSYANPKKRFVPSFVLTLEEKKVICFVLLAFLLGLTAKQYRDKHPPAPPAPIKAVAKAKRYPSPVKAIQKQETNPEGRLKP